jgi:hypothetical protein
VALSAAPVASAASAVITAAQSPVVAALAPQIVIGGVELLRGRVDFEDHFIRPNYRADLTELNGRIGGFSSVSPQMAAVQLSGRAAGTAQLSIQGTVNPWPAPGHGPAGPGQRPGAGPCRPMPASTPAMPSSAAS